MGYDTCDVDNTLPEGSIATAFVLPVPISIPITYIVNRVRQDKANLRLHNDVSGLIQGIKKHPAGGPRDDSV